jgi:hypothetical protein
MVIQPGRGGLFAAGLGFTPRPVVPGKEAYLAPATLQPAPLGPDLWDERTAGPGMSGLLRLWSTGPHVAFAGNGDEPVAGAGRSSIGPTEAELQQIREAVKLNAEGRRGLRKAFHLVRQSGDQVEAEAITVWISVANRIGQATEPIEDHKLLAEAASTAQKIANPFTRGIILTEIAEEMAARGLRSAAHSTFIQAAEAIAEIEDPYYRCRGRLMVAEEMAARGLASHELLYQAAQDAAEIELPADPLLLDARHNAKGSVGQTMIRASCLLEDPDLLDHAIKTVKGIKNDIVSRDAQSKVATEMAVQAARLKDRNLMHRAAQTAAGMSDSLTQIKVAALMVVLAARLQDLHLLAEAMQIVSNISDPFSHTRGTTQWVVTELIERLGLPVGGQARAPTPDEASEMYLEKWTEIQAFIAESLSTLAVFLEDRNLLVHATRMVSAIPTFPVGDRDEDTNSRIAYTELDIAINMAELGIRLEDRDLLLEAVQKARQIQSRSVRLQAQPAVARELVRFSIRLLEKTSRLAAPFGGLVGERFRTGVTQLVSSAPASLGRDLGTLPSGFDFFRDDSGLLQDLAYLGYAESSLVSDPARKQLRRKTMRQLKTEENVYRWSVLTTTLRAFEDNPASEALLQLARNWQDYADPRFPQLLSQLIKTGNPKALNFLTHLLGESDFAPRNHPDRSYQYRFWLLKKLCEIRHLDRDLYPYLKARITSGTPATILDRWLQGAVREFGLTPSLAVMKFLLEETWRDTDGKPLNTPQAVFAYLKLWKDKFEAQRDRFKLLEYLRPIPSKNAPKKAFFYYLHCAGRTHFALIDKYTPEQFQEILRAIRNDVGPVHEGVMDQFHVALNLAGQPPEQTQQIMNRLRDGRWPLADQPYAKQIRIDVPPEKVIEGLNERFAAAFSPDQLGAMLIASLSPSFFTQEETRDSRVARILEKIEASQGLQELPAFVSALREVVPDLTERIAKRWELDFDRRFPIPLRAILGLTSGAETPTLSTTALKQLYPNENVLGSFLEKFFAISVSPAKFVHIGEWKSHVKEVFQGLKRIHADIERVSAKTVTLRFLDKGKEMIEVLRFADAAQCCFTSEEDNFENQKEWLTRIWKDPLSFVFLIEDNEPDAERREAIGFVFGSFGIKDKKPVILMNGVYMQGKTNEAVLSILKTIENDFSRPLGATHQFVAATLGGQTHLDPVHLRATGDDTVYKNKPTKVTRLRALMDAWGDREPETEIYDDIDVGLNRPAKTKKHVWWKRLR